MSQINKFEIREARKKKSLNNLCGELGVMII